LSIIFDIRAYFKFKINEGFLNCLKYINKTLDNPKIFIGENGFPEDEGVDDSKNKIAYHTVSVFNMLITLRKI